LADHLVDRLVDLIALALVILAIGLAVAVVLAVALSARMRRRLRRAAMLTIWATASLLVIAGLGAAVNDAVQVSNSATNEVGIIQD
jgi:ABC-type sugar transport system permease subunit